jgi:hypothetical protein
MVIGATDLINNNANGNSFIPAQAPSAYQFGFIGSVGADRRYYLVPGTLPIGQLVTESTGNPYDPANSFPLLFNQPSIVISLILTSTTTLPTGVSIVLKIYKNSDLSPVLTLTRLSTDGNIKQLSTQSAVFTTNDTLSATVETVGNPGSGGIFSVSVGYY